MSILQRTPLYNFHQRHGGRLVPFAGWELPVQYTGILEEHKAVRTAAGLFDVSHMGEVSVEGPEALSFLQYLLTNDLSRLKKGSAIYSPMCYEDGGCVDDVIVYDRGEDSYLICVNASNVEKDVKWMQEHSARFDCTVTDLSDSFALLALQGPNAEAVLHSAGVPEGFGKLKRFQFASASIGDKAVTLSRTGYTGEDGCELYCKPEEAEAIAEALLAAGVDHGLQLCGLGARDSLRLEAGFPLYGHEIGQDITPIQGGLGWAVKLGKRDEFIGQAALRAEAEKGATKQLIHFTLNDKKIARAGTAVVWNERPVGTVTSGSYSPIINKPIGAALVEVGTQLEELSVVLRNNSLPLVISKPPLHRTRA